MARQLVPAGRVGDRYWAWPVPNNPQCNEKQGPDRDCLFGFMTRCGTRYREPRQFADSVFWNSVEDEIELIAAAVPLGWTQLRDLRARTNR